MKEIINIWDEKLEYISHEVKENIITIHIRSKERSAICPYCGIEAKKAHSVYQRKLQDLPIQGKKTKIVFHRRKFFCENAKCGKKTFAEPVSFADIRAVRTRRLDETIRVSALNQSSVAASKFLRENIANVSKSTICDMLKKERLVNHPT